MWRKFIKYICWFKIIVLGLYLQGPSLLLAQTEVAPTEVEEEYDTQKLNKILVDYNKVQKQILDQSALEKIEESNENEDPQLKKVIAKKNPNTNNSDGLKKKKYSELIREGLEPISLMSEKEIIELIKGNIKPPFGSYLDKYPKIGKFLAVLLKDKQAMPQMASILDQEKKLIQFSSIMLFTIIFGFILKRILKREGRSVIKAIYYWFLRLAILYTIRIIVLVHFFGNELKPIYQIALNIFF